MGKLLDGQRNADWLSNMAKCATAAHKMQPCASGNIALSLRNVLMTESCPQKREWPQMPGEMLKDKYSLHDCHEFKHLQRHPNSMLDDGQRHSWEFERMLAWPTLLVEAGKHDRSACSAWASPSWCFGAEFEIFGLWRCLEIS